MRHENCEFLATTIILAFHLPSMTNSFQHSLNRKPLKHILSSIQFLFNPKIIFLWLTSENFESTLLVLTCSKFIVVINAVANIDMNFGHLRVHKSSVRCQIDSSIEIIKSSGRVEPNSARNCRIVAGACWYPLVEGVFLHVHRRSAIESFIPTFCIGTWHSAC